MTINKKIGNTMYRVSVNFSKTSKECLEDKILRLAKTDLSSSKIYDIMELPQTGMTGRNRRPTGVFAVGENLEWLLEGGSL